MFRKKKNLTRNISDKIFSKIPKKTSDFWEGGFLERVVIPGNDSLKCRVSDDSLHGVGFTRGGLTVGEDGSIVAAQNVLHDRLGRRTVNLLLGHVRLQNLVEHIKLALKKTWIHYQIR